MVHQGFDYNGLWAKYYKPDTFPRGCIDDDMPRQTCPPIDNGDYHADGFLSAKCRCKQNPVVCDPEDEWQTIFQCDNTNSSVDLSCSYTKVKEVQNFTSFETKNLK